MASTASNASKRTPCTCLAPFGYLRAVLRGQLIIGNVVVAVGYLVLGYLGLSLAVPPSPASPFWPAAGFAAVCYLRWGHGLLPGLATGALCANSLFGVLTDGDVTSAHHQLWAGIVLGTLLRSHLGLWLSRLSGNAQNNPYRYRTMLLMGPVASLASALVGALSLRWVGFDSPDDFALTFVIWWLGDAIGTFAIWHLAAAFIPGDDPGRRARITLVGVPILLVSLAVLAAFLYSRETKHRGLIAEAFRAGAERAEHLQRGFEHTYLLADGMLGLFATPRQPELHEFEAFAAHLAESYGAVQALVWVKEVPRERRAAHVAWVRSLGYPDYAIREAGPGGLVVAGDHAVHYASTFVYPLQGNRAAHGLDVWRAPAAPAFREAAESNQHALSAPIRLVQERGDQAGCVLALPLWGERTPGVDRPTGFLAVVIRVGDLTQASLRSFPEDDFALALRAGAADAFLEVTPGTSPSRGTRYTSEHEVHVGRASWTLTTTPTARWLSKRQDWSSHALLLAGMLLAGLVGTLLRVLVERTRMVAEQVRERTSDLTRVNDELARARDAADAANLAKGEFLATMTHEIRTPLNGVVGTLDLLAGTTLSEEQLRLTDVAQASSEALLVLVEDILDISRIDAGGLTLESIPLQPVGVIESALQVLSTAAKDKGLDLWYEGPWATDEVSGDPSRLRQLLINLVGNAIKFTEAGRVICRLTLVGDTLCIEVEDTGVGFEVAQEEALFEAFTQADASTTRTHGGSGLGLAISKRLLDAMGGELSVSSEPGEGSTFRVALPLAARPRFHPSPYQLVPIGSDPVFLKCIEALGSTSGGTTLRLVHLDEPGAPRAEERRAPTASVEVALSRAMAEAARWPRCLSKPLLPGGIERAAHHRAPSGSQPAPPKPVPARRRHVLLVEDSEVNQLVAMAMLEKLGVDADLAEDGEQALERLRGERRYDAVLMDCHMPGVDGFEATRRYRRWEELEGRGRVPFIALTADVTSSVQERCFETGMDAFLSKPITLARLEASLKSTWDGE